MTWHANRRPRTALVLGAGGIKTACHVGLLRVLERENIPIDLIVGSSGGAVFGAAYALGTPVQDIEHWITRFWTKEIFQDYGYREMMKMLWPRRMKFNEGFGIIKGEEVRKLFLRLLGGLTFDDTKIPLRIVASDLQAGEPVVLREGLLVDAIRASISMPIFFQPYRMNGRFLVDGAVCAPQPLEFAIAEGAEVIISMGFPNRPNPRIDSPLRLVTQIMKISGTQMYRAALAFYSRNPNIEIIPLEVELDSALGMKDIAEIPRLVDAGEEEAAEFLPVIRKTLRDFHGPKNRMKRRLRSVARRALRTSLVDLPAFNGNGHN